jgi:hypothetical protein
VRGALASVQHEGFGIAPEVVGSDAIVVKLSGSCDSQATAVLDQFMGALHLEVKRVGAQSVVLDCDGLYFMNSAAVKCFVTWLSRAPEGLEATEHLLDEVGGRRRRGDDLAGDLALERLVARVSLLEETVAGDEEHVPRGHPEEERLRPDGEVHPEKGRVAIEGAEGRRRPVQEGRVARVRVGDLRSAVARGGDVDAAAGAHDLAGGKERHQAAVELLEQRVRPTVRALQAVVLGLDEDRAHRGLDAVTRGVGEKDPVDAGPEGVDVEDVPADALEGLVRGREVDARRVRPAGRAGHHALLEEAGLLDVGVEALVFLAQAIEGLPELAVRGGQLLCAVVDPPFELDAELLEG